MTESFTENFAEKLAENLAENVADNSVESSGEYSNCLIDQYNERANLNFLHRFLAANFDPVKKSKNWSNPSSNQ